MSCHPDLPVLSTRQAGLAVPREEFYGDPGSCHIGPVIPDFDPGSSIYNHFPVCRPRLDRGSSSNNQLCLLFITFADKSNTKSHPWYKSLDAPPE